MGWLKRLSGNDAEVESRTVPESNTRTALVRGAPEYHELLSACCRNRTAALVAWPVASQLRWVFFSRATQDAVWFELVPGSPGIPSRPAAGVGVNFMLESNVGVFASFERLNPQPGDNRLISVELPAQILLEGRRMFRVPTPGMSGLIVVCRRAGKELPGGSIVDISASGVQVLFKSVEDPLFEARQPLDLVIGYGGREVRVQGTIRWHAAGDNDFRAGILFHNAFNGFAEDSGERINDLVRAVERTWIQNRVR